MEKLFSDMCDVAKCLEKAFSLSYGKPEDYISSFCKGGKKISMLRLFHYLPYFSAEKDFAKNKSDRIGSSPHTDWGFLTLILQQPDAEGLQCFNNNEWYDIPPVRGALIVNCGDYFSLLTDGQYISPLHRVVSNGKERLSAVLFYYPDYEARIPVLGKQDYSLFANQQDGNNSNKSIALDIEKMSFGEFIAEKWQQVKRD
jgi:isopenicillin N synthase-like dioxygenase